MINSVRQTVLAIANKENYGYITPTDFNLYAKQAQLDIFEDYFYRYNQWINRQNQRVSGSGYADIVKNLEEVIDTFSVEQPLFNVLNKYTIPSSCYLLNKVLINTDLKHEGTTTSENNLTDTGVDFIASGIVSGDTVAAIVDGSTVYSIVLTVSQETITTTDENLWTESGLNYAIYKTNKVKESEKISHSKITMLNASNLTAPTIGFPVFTQSEDKIAIYPSSVDSVGQVKVQYIRTPKQPNWTFIGGSVQAMFDQSASDYQDLEIPSTDEPLIISKILKYIGISIRESDVYQAAAAEETKEQQKQG